MKNQYHIEITRGDFIGGDNSAGWMPGLGNRLKCEVYSEDRRWVCGGVSDPSPQVLGRCILEAIATVDRKIEDQSGLSSEGDKK